MKQKNYFAYIRVSSKEQELSHQRKPIEEYAQKHGLTIVEWFEEKKTAAKLGRTVFARMLTRLGKDDVRGVLIHKIDRGARNLKDWANLAVLIDRGVDVQFVHDSLDLRTRGGRLSADIQAIVAADYIRNLRDEVIKGLRGRLNAGIFPFAAPVGYLDTGEGNVKIPDPERAPLVRLAFERYATGTVGLKDLRWGLRDAGLTMRRSGKPLSLHGVSVMLNNPFYIGIMRIKKTGATYQGKHEPLISKALFERVQQVLRGRLVSRVFKHDFLFRRTVRCAGCGHFLVGERKKIRYVYYRCHGDTCSGVTVREEVLAHAVETSLAYLAFDDALQREVKAVALEMQATADEEIAKLRATFIMHAGKIEERLTRLTDAYLDQMLDKDTFERRKEHLFMEQRGIRDSLEKLSAKDIPINQALEKLELGNAAYLSYKTGIPAEKRALVEATVSNFSVRGKEPMIALKSPYQELANWHKMQLSAPPPTTLRMQATQLLDIAASVDREAIKPSVPQHTPEPDSDQAA